MAKRNSFDEKRGVTMKQKSKVMRCTPPKTSIPRVNILQEGNTTGMDIIAIEKAPKSAGRDRLLKYLSGERLAPVQAIKAKCCDCMGFFYDGKLDCEIPDCPLYPYMPYRQKSTTTGRKASARSGKTRGE